MSQEDSQVAPLPLDRSGGTLSGDGSQPPPAGSQTPRRRRSRSVRRAQREAPFVGQEHDDAQQTFVKRWRSSYLTLWQGSRLVEWVCDSVTETDGVVTERWTWHYIE